MPTVRRAPEWASTAADINGDGWQDLFVANVDQEMFSLYENNKNETFRDTAHANQWRRATDC